MATGGSSKAAAPTPAASSSSSQCCWAQGWVGSSGVGPPGLLHPPISLPPAPPTPHSPRAGVKITQQCPGVLGGRHLCPQGWGSLTVGAGGWGPRCPPRPSLWCYGPTTPPGYCGDRGGLSPAVSPSWWGQNWDHAAAQPGSPHPFPPSQGCTFKTFCIYFAFYYL